MTRSTDTFAADAAFTEAPYVLPGAVRHTLALDDGPGGAWEVTVALPPPGLREQAGEGPFPALYLLDGYFTFAVAAQVAQTTFEFAAGQLRPLAVVGISPAGEDRDWLRDRRDLDLTPTPARPREMLSGAALGTGGAAAMLETIVEQIVPRLEAAHPLDPADRALGGWSLGGLFTCWALLRGAPFQRYLAVSPSLWWDEKLLLDERRSPTGELGPADVYLAIGEGERDFATVWPALDAEEATALEGLDMVADMAAFAERLRRQPRLRVAAEVIPAEFHSTVWGAAVTRGIVHLYRSDDRRL